MNFFSEMRIWTIALTETIALTDHPGVAHEADSRDAAVVMVSAVAEDVDADSTKKMAKKRGMLARNGKAERLKLKKK